MKYVKSLALVISQYPALAIGVVVAALILFADYGVPVGGQHSLDIQSVVAAILALLGAILTHTQVTPAAPAPAPAPAAGTPSSSPAPPPPAA